MLNLLFTLAAPAAGDELTPAIFGYAAEPPASNCPVRSCRSRGESLLQTEESSTYINTPIELHIAAEEGKSHRVNERTGRSVFDINFSPGHWTCSKCDSKACKNCNVVCDLRSCMGEFYSQECWCRKKSELKIDRPLWKFRSEDGQFLEESVARFFCDKNCAGAQCDIEGLQCMKREEACRPWWWCQGLEPPKEAQPAKPGWGDGMAFSALQANATVKRSLLKQHPAPSEEAPPAALLQTEHAVALSDPAEPNDFKAFNFENGVFTCGEGGLPPRIKNPTSMMWEDRGYIIFEGQSCTTIAPSRTKCFCWNEFLRIQGKDPLMSEFMCNEDCTTGPCAGNTCSVEKPGPAPEQSPPPEVDPVDAEAQQEAGLHTQGVRMVPK
mmetsp:Transcript_39293/g.94494  ORF Transcript_39293/g.94494 Transcript_39293/m.94494 type:complete len:382 (+) Transcript_39293:138-1283(+)